MTALLVGTEATTPTDLSSPVVASVPGDHAYVRHLGPLDGGGPVRLRDPEPDGAERSRQQRWWPPVMLDPAWVAGHDFDVAHVHFGFDARTPAQLQEFVDAVHRRGRPLVFTVHDLRNPHHRTPETHDAQLDVLVQGADALVTLTPGAAAEVERRWGRTPVVVPHPHVVDLDLMHEVAARRARAVRGPFRVGLHVKSARAGMDPGAVLPVLLEAVAGLRGAVLQVNAHRELLDPTSRTYDRRLATAVRATAAHDHVELRVHDYLADDRAFVAYLAGLDVSVLPYRFGTHSGWLEACRDVGTTVVAPTCGFYAEQGPVLSYGLDEHRFDADSLVAAVRRAFDERPSYGATVAERRTQRAAVAAAHGELYRSVTVGA